MTRAELQAAVEVILGIHCTPDKADTILRAADAYADASDPRAFGLTAADLRAASNQLYDAADTRLDHAEWAHDRQVRFGQIRSRLRGLADAIAENSSTTGGTT